MSKNFEDHVLAKDFRAYSLAAVNTPIELATGRDHDALVKRHNEELIKARESIAESERQSREQEQG